MLPVLQAEEQLRQIQAASVPHMTDELRRDVIDSLTRRVGGDEFRPPRATPEMLAAMGIPVRTVPKKVTTDG